MAPKNVFAKINPLEAANAGIRQARVVHVVEHGTTRAGNLAQVSPPAPGRLIRVAKALGLLDERGPEPLGMRFDHVQIGRAAHG